MTTSAPQSFVEELEEIFKKCTIQSSNSQCNETTLLELKHRVYSLYQKLSVYGVTPGAQLPPIQYAVPLGDFGRKFDVLQSLIEHLPERIRLIIFCEQVSDIKAVKLALASIYGNANVKAIHGQLPDFRRVKIYEAIRKGVRLVVASSILAKSCPCCDCLHVPVVVNFDLPNFRDNSYLHKTSMARGNPAVVLTFFDDKDKNQNNRLKKFKFPNSIITATDTEVVKLILGKMF